MERQLYRPRKNRVVAGVCSGFAEYFSIDPTIIRIITIIIALSGAGIFAYIIAAVIMPNEEKVFGGTDDWKSSTYSNTDEFIHGQEKAKEEWGQPTKYSSEKNKLVMGAILVGLGVVFLIKQFIPGFDWKYLFPLLLIGIGGVIILKGR